MLSIKQGVLNTVNRTGGVKYCQYNRGVNDVNGTGELNVVNRTSHVKC